MFARLPVTPRRIPEGWGEAEREQFVAIADAMKNAQAAEVELVVLGVLGYVGRLEHTFFFAQTHAHDFRAHGSLRARTAALPLKLKTQK